MIKLQTLPFTSKTLAGILKKFPEIKEHVGKFVNEIIEKGEFDTVTSDVAYTPRDKFPKTITIKHECKSKYGKKVKYIQCFTCTWEEEMIVPFEDLIG